MRGKRDLSENVEWQTAQGMYVHIRAAEYLQAGRYGHSSRFAFRGGRLGTLVGRAVIHGSHFQKNGTTKKRSPLKSP